MLHRTLPVPPTNQPPTRTAARDVVYLHLRQMIVSGALAPGSRVSEKELTALVGMSRTPLRESVKALETQGLVTRLANGRLRVVPLTPRELEELFSVRAAIERLIVVSVATEASDASIEEVLGPIISGIRRGLEVSLREAGLCGERFHNALREMCQNKVASTILGELSDRIARYRNLGPDHDPQRRMEAAREHIQIYQLIASRRPEEAARAMEQHIQHSREVGLRFLSDSTPINGKA